MIAKISQDPLLIQETKQVFCLNPNNNKGQKKNKKMKIQL